MPDSQWPEGEITLMNCDREPIHLLGQVQDYGALIAMSRDWIVEHASENTDAILGLPAGDLIGADLRDRFPADFIEKLREKFDLLGPMEDSVRFFGIEVNAAHMDVAIHISGSSYILEFEPRSMAPDGLEISLIHPLLARVRSAETIEAAVTAAASALRTLTDFGRVMVYRFDHDGTGVVIAESAATGQDSFLGLRFPATDVPKQARVLYEKNLLRLISDVDGPVHDIVPTATPAGTPLDLSMAVTRSVSPIHLEYLRNMGVRASMSVSILRKGKLWGLFACHDTDRARVIGMERRTTIEVFAQMFAYELASKEDEIVNRADAQSVHDVLIARTGQSADFIENIDVISSEIAKVIPFDGIAIYSDEKFAARGHAPTAEEFAALSDWLLTQGAGEVFATHDVFDRFPEARDFAKPPAGLLSLPISRAPEDFIVLFRDEARRTVEWAGNPDKAVIGEDGAQRLSPRKSFARWQEIVRDTSEPWTGIERAIAEKLRFTLLEVVLRVVDEAGRERRRAADKQSFLIAELNHRVRNILNLIKGVIRQSRGANSTIESFSDDLGGRINALARAHDQLTQADLSLSSTRKMIEVEFGAYGIDGPRLAMTGPDLHLVAEAYSTFALVVHELVTNSAKYGALSVPEGRVEIDVLIGPDGDVVIDWRDRGGPPVTPPTRRGFGTTIIERSIPHELSGEAELHFAPDGMHARFRIPARHVDPVQSKRAQMSGASSPQQTTQDTAETGLSGKVLVVEDNVVIALDTSDILEDAGAEEVLVAATAAQGLGILADHEIAFAVLDVNLGSGTSLEVAEALAAKGVPFVLATGYGEGSRTTEGFPESSILKKPYSPTDLVAALVRSARG